MLNFISNKKYSISNGFCLKIEFSNNFDHFRILMQFVAAFFLSYLPISMAGGMANDSYILHLLMPAKK